MKNIYKKILVKKDYLPFYVYDYETIKGQILKLKKNLPPNVKVFYSVKANPNIAILQIMRNFELNVEIVSMGEFLAAQKAGFAQSDILFAGLTKSDQELSAAIINNIDLMSLESLAEIQRTNKIAGDLGKKQKIILRFNLRTNPQKDKTEKYALTGFGISLNDTENIFKNFTEQFKNLTLSGIHFYEANRLYDHNNLIKTINHIFSVVQDIEKKFKFKLPIIDIGGGFGASVEEEFPVAPFSVQLAALIKKYRFDKRKIVLELGRYLVNQSGSYIAPIIEVKKNGQNQYIIVGGIQTYLNKIFGRPAEHDRFIGNINEYRVEILPQRISGLKPTVICGQLTSTADTFGRTFNCQVLLPEPNVGNLVMISGVGAYGLTQALSFFCSRPTAAEFLLINGKLELIRDKGGPEDFLKGQRIPEVLK